MLIVGGVHCAGNAHFAAWWTYKERGADKWCVVHGLPFVLEGKRLSSRSFSALPYKGRGGVLGLRHKKRAFRPLSSSPPIPLHTCLGVGGDE
jgi:hypothetical protein